MLPSRCHAIDLDPIANSTITVNLDRSFEELLRDSNISVHTRTVISLLMEEKRRHMEGVARLNEFSDDFSLLLSEAQNLRYALSLCQDSTSVHTPGLPIQATPPCVVAQGLRNPLIHPTHLSLPLFQKVQHVIHQREVMTFFCP